MARVWALVPLRARVQLLRLRPMMWALVPLRARAQVPLRLQPRVRAAVVAAGRARPAGHLTRAGEMEGERIVDTREQR